MNFTAGLTLLLICTSLTNVLGYGAAVRGDRRRAALLLGVTALGGALFLVGQAQESFGIWGPGRVGGGLVSATQHASAFYITTGYHGLHVLVGVLYISTILVQYLRGRVGPSQSR